MKSGRLYSLINKIVLFIADGGASYLLNIQPLRKEPYPETPCSSSAPERNILAIPFWAHFLGSIES